jgi:hypothetical protein
MKLVDRPLACLRLGFDFNELLVDFMWLPVLQPNDVVPCLFKSNNDLVELGVDGRGVAISLAEPHLL